MAIVAGALVILFGRYRHEQSQRGESAEPRIDSTPLSRWLLTHPYQGRDLKVETAVSQAGTSAVPALVRVAELGLSPTELLFMRIWPHLPRPLHRATASWIVADPIQTTQMIDLLGSLGPDASNSVPALLRLAKIDLMGTGQAAKVALLNIAPQNPEVRALELAWLNSNSLAASHYFCEAQCTYPEVPAILLRKIIADPAGTDNELRALAQYGAAASTALPVVRERFKAGHENALFVLLAMGPPAAPAAEDLAALLGSDETTNQRILDGLRRIGPGAVSVLPRIEPYQTATNPVTRLLAEATVASLRGEPTVVLPSFQRTMETHRPYGTPYGLSFSFLGDHIEYSLGPRQMACWLAGEMGPTATPMLPALEACFEDERELLRVLAAWGHWSIAHQADRVLPVIRKVLRDSDPSIQQVAICLLAEMGPAAAAAEPELRTIMKSDLSTRRLVGKVLVQIHRDGR